MCGSAPTSACASDDWSFGESVHRLVCDSIGLAPAFDPVVKNQLWAKLDAVHVGPGS